MPSAYTTLISVAQLRELQKQPKDLLLFDCSFDLVQPDAGLAQYQAGHIPGALYAHLNRDLSAAHAGTSGGGAHAAASGGRHPLPTRAAFAAWLGSCGLRPGMQAVVYDRQGANYCGRLWWMLKWLGHAEAAVLDGGLQAWERAGAGLSTETTQPLAAAPYPMADALLPLVDVASVMHRLGHADQHILDARASARYRGEVEPLDPVAGHIPGALNRPFGSNLDSDGRFKPAEQLRAEFAALLGTRSSAHVVHHCGSGVSAIPNLLAMEIAGLHGSALFAGSWSEWCSDPSRPVARG